MMTGLLVAETGHLHRKAVVPPGATRVEPNRDDLRAGRRDAEIPPHGTTTRVRQRPDPERWAGVGAEGLRPEIG